MLDSFPFQYKKVLVPRGEKQAKSFSLLVEKYGGIPVEIPLIAFRPIRDGVHFPMLDIYDWVIFTSGTAVEIFFSFVKKEMKVPKIAAIGSKTEEALRKRGLEVDFVPSAFVAEVFTKEFSAYIHRGERVLLPKGNLARDCIKQELTETGAVVDEAIIYENYLPDESRKKLANVLQGRQLDILLFTSSSTVDHFMEVVKEYELRDQLADCIIGCIGPVTMQRLLEYDLPVHVYPKEYTVAGMMKSMADYLEKHK
ncbi:uroporphyrinogen-III synthase [Neobacillus fumarioli]|uniref:uroporphyrinogen-III synthase n=1 Tax=Neobacillus fumarioli TaxID=105229 RepID=UPI0008348E93|nr:uroporphyrinogen-III synthase [Neobacillus fumarioli]